MTHTISILGAGWLGLPLGQTLAEKGYVVKGSTTRPEKVELLKEYGLLPYVFSLEPDLIRGAHKDFFETDVLILNIPPGRRDPEVATSYPSKIKTLLQQIPNPKALKCIFVSSTSVYGNQAGIVSEESLLQPSTPSGRALVEVEKLIRDQIPLSTLLRMGGLVGGSRHPGRFLAGRTGLSGGNQAINLIHLADCIGIIQAVIEQNAWGEAFNCVADGHPIKKDYYTRAAVRLGLDAPIFREEDSSTGKIVANQKVKEALAYYFRYPDPYDMLTNKNV